MYGKFSAQCFMLVALKLARFRRRNIFQVKQLLGGESLTTSRMHWFMVGI